MSGVMVLGDIHGHFQRVNHLIQREQPDIILQCGDIGYWPRMGGEEFKELDTSATRIYFCDGNIDDIVALRELSQGCRLPVEISPNIFYMPRGSVLTLPDGRRALFVGGAMSRDKHQRSPGVDWFPEEEICDLDMCGLPPPPVDMVISHTCPAEFTVSNFKVNTAEGDDISRHYLSAVLKRYQPGLWFFGHWHLRAEGVFMQTRWYALGWQKSINEWYLMLPASV